MPLPWMTRVACTLVAWSITWLLVSTRPPAVTIIPVPSAVSPLYLSVAVMSTRPGSTFFATIDGSSGAAEAPLPDALSCGPGTPPPAEPPAETPAAGVAPGWRFSATVAPAPMLAASAATRT